MRPMPHAAGDSRASLTGRERLAGEGVPTACTTIEEVGSTGVGALTIGFLIFAVCTVVFLAKANTSGEQRKCVRSLVSSSAFRTLAASARKRRPLCCRAAPAELDDARGGCVCLSERDATELVL